MPLVIAHRGASGYELENTLAAFRVAVAQGADAVELDVHVAADGTLLVHHDADIAGLPIAEHDSARLRSRTLSNGEPVPTLEEALEAIGANLDSWVEVKALPPQADQALFAVFDRAPAPARCHVHSFDHRIVTRLASARPTLRTGVLSASYPLDPTTQIAQAGASVLWQQQQLVDVPLVAQCHAAGALVFAWTVNSEDRARTLAADGVDAICTNVPDRIRRALS